MNTSGLPAGNTAFTIDAGDGTDGSVGAAGTGAVIEGTVNAICASSCGEMGDSVTFTRGITDGFINGVDVKPNVIFI